MTFDTRKFRDALGRFATGVTVVSSAPDGFPPFGMTVNSFASLSLEPPLILWSLQKYSDLAEAWEAATHFAVNILAQEQEDESNRYARKYAHDLVPGDYRIGSTGNPVLHGCLASFECRIESRIDAGDHTIFVGRVLEFEEQPHGNPLIFYRGQYRELH